MHVKKIIKIKSKIKIKRRLKMYLRRLKDLREDNELKQENVAKYLKITRQQYQLYESGKRKLPIDKLIEICKLYRVTADYILELTQDPKN